MSPDESFVLLIVNPAAKKASRWKITQAVSLLSEAGYKVKTLHTEKSGDAECFAKHAFDEGVSFIIAGGGDGTFNEVMNGIAYTGIKMAILPLGTTNVLAKELGIPEDVKGAVGRAVKGKDHTISLGKIRYFRDSRPLTRYFCLMAGVGFDGRSVYGVNPWLKKYSGKLAYILSGLKNLLGFPFEPLKIFIDHTECEGYSVIIGNASKYGGHYRVTPDANLFMPELYACIMKGKRRADLLRYTLGIMCGRHLQFDDVLYLRACSIMIEGNAHIQTDGDYLGHTPASITIAAGAIKIVF
jgi:diacylglycerol kinase (ATP)